MQLLNSFDEDNFPFVIAKDVLSTQVFLVNVNSHQWVPLINLKQVHNYDGIHDIQQTSNLHDPTKAKHYTNLKEITFHFKLSQLNKDGGDRQLIYCKLKLSSESIQMLIKT